MLIGYAIIAVPTGIITAEMTRKEKGRICIDCGMGNEDSANFCGHCGKAL
jgi:voltage-gated potassium channel